ncbi:ATP-binding cassette domain-containing protein [Proteiniphilum sp.]|uniref:ATP-binding cassette domain-containing protein n=1 Tax=Proteiniphilum sp. TaxID=1926877 RepID=UPI002B1FE85F|nr:ATP-binding cassette domain-containing protein [Proteiniphilum sp.]MEA4916975.1 ATP-binding cassette domain-containing protein [Proteiniphilum sp.]
MSHCITLQNVVPRMPESPFTQPINWDINRGEVWSIVGRNGSGKSLLSNLICGKIAIQSGNIRYHLLEEPDAKMDGRLPSQQIRKIEFNAAYSLLDYRKLFYQQRFNNSENEEIPLVSELLPLEKISEENRLIFNTFHIFDLMDRKFIHLSSGELRKFLIARVLLDNPKMLIFDNPFIGLDEASRNALNEMFLFLLHQCHIQLLILAPSVDDLPACTTHILEMKDCMINYRGEKSDFIPERLPGDGSKHDNSGSGIRSEIDWHDFTLEERSSESDELVSMNHVAIAYGDRIIQKDVNWIIQKSEKWALLGPNGSGKSTLLSYIFADNPQAYAKNIRLFGRKRGTGESIWDIKRRIGFSSSELHLYYRENVTCTAVVASGFFDSIGLYRKCNPQQTLLAEKLLKILQIDHLKERPFLKVSSGEQRLLFFARALIKNPELLILDEPFHGLDQYNKARCTAIVESFAHQPGKSLIYVTHRREEIPDCIDHFMILQQYERIS